MASTQIKVDIPTGIQAADVVLTDEVTTAIQNSALSVERRAKNLAPKMTGTLKRSLTSEVTTINGVPSGIVGSPLKYARAMEYGAGPSAIKPQKPFTPPSAPILAYAAKKGLTTQEGWALWQSIRKKGIKPHPFLVPAFDEKQQSITERIQAAIQTAVERMRG